MKRTTAAVLTAALVLAATAAQARPHRAATGCDVTGTAGNDVITEYAPGVTICMGAGDDTAYAYGFGDVVYGGDGTDMLWLNGGTAWGGAGDDTIRANRDHLPDTAHGGDGTDICYVEDNPVEPIDAWWNCETVVVTQL